jgi:hypothetical protein
VSEYVFKEGSGDHSIGADDVVIILEETDTRRHPWTITRAEGHKVATILFVIRSSKADRTGKGRYLYLSRKSDVESHLRHQVRRHSARHRRQRARARRRVSRLRRRLRGAPMRTRAPLCGLGVRNS